MYDRREVSQDIRDKHKRSCVERKLRDRKTNKNLKAQLNKLCR